MRFNRLTVATALAASLAFAGPTAAHEGHDAGPPAVENPTSGQPRTVATSEDYEIVALLKGSELLVYVDRFSDNSPLTQGTLTVTIGTDEIRAETVTGGVFKLQSAALQKPGKHELIFSVQENEKSDLLIASLEVPASAHDETEAAPSSTPALVRIKTAITQLTALQAGAVGSGSLGFGFLLAFLRRRKKAEAPEHVVAENQEPKPEPKTATVERLRPKSAGTIAAAAFLFILAAQTPKAFAHGDEEHGDGKQPVLVAGDAPRRLPDASIYLPKPSQRLLEVRTVQTKETTAKPSVSLVGRVIANPNRSGLVQSTLGGRFTPPAGGLPTLGQPVKVGDVLGYVAPYIAAIDKSDSIQTAGNLDQDIALAETRLERAKRLFAVNAGTRVQVEDIEIQLNGLKSRRAALGVSQSKPEPLLAPIDGVVAGAKVVAGQVVGTSDILFQIFDPASLWVEAFAFDPSRPVAYTDAMAVAQDGVNLALSFIGQSRTLQQQSTVLNFEIKNPPSSLNVGMPVTVMAQTGEFVEAIVLPKAAVVRAANGENIVWLHTEPERFVARPVRTNPFDGDRILVAAGLAAGERVVVQGAELVNQVR